MAKKLQILNKGDKLTNIHSIIYMPTGDIETPDPDDGDGEEAESISLPFSDQKKIEEAQRM